MRKDMGLMKRALLAMALVLLTALAAAQTSEDLARQVERGVADLSRARIKQLASGEWLRERLEIDSIAQGGDPRDAKGPLQRVVQARIAVFRSASVPEAMARSSSLAVNMPGRRYQVEMRFEPDAALGQWVFAGGRYWILDDQGRRHLELRMFADLLREAPLDAPHELAWAIMSP